MPLLDCAVVSVNIAFFYIQVIVYTDDLVYSN